MQTLISLPSLVETNHSKRKVGVLEIQIWELQLQTDLHVHENGNMYGTISVLRQIYTHGCNHADGSSQIDIGYSEQT